MRNLFIALLLAGCSPSPFKQVTEGMKYEKDIDQYGVADKWVDGCPPKGDCEDMVLCLLDKFRARGDNMSQSRLLLCITDKGVYHAIAFHQGIYYDPAFKKEGRQPTCTLIGGYTVEEAKNRAAIELVAK